MVDVKKELANMYKEMHDKAEENICHVKVRVRCLNTGVIYNSLSQAAEDTGCSKSHISYVCNGVLKTAKGLKFEFVDKEAIEIRENKPKKTEKRKYVKNGEYLYKRKRFKDITWSNQKPIYCWTNGESYKSVSEASREIGLSRSTIMTNCKANSSEYVTEDNLKHTSTGYAFQFDEDGWC